MKMGGMQAPSEDLVNRPEAARILNMSVPGFNRKVLGGQLVPAIRAKGNGPNREVLWFRRADVLKVAADRIAEKKADIRKAERLLNAEIARA